MYYQVIPEAKGTVISMFEYSPKNLMEITNILQNHGANGAIIKALSKNHNDKNQVYSGSDFNHFTLTLNLNFLIV